MMKPNSSFHDFYPPFYQYQTMSNFVKNFGFRVMESNGGHMDTMRVPMQQALFWKVLKPEL